MTTAQVLEQNLTEDQRLAVLDDHRDILCLACAGSGKSRTLAFRIAYLVANGCPADSIVAFTFTDKAAESIKRRVSEALSKFELPQTLVGANVYWHHTFLLSVFTWKCRRSVSSV